MTKPLPDWEAREVIRTELDTTFLVEAGAGSGKTASLVDRMTALVASGRCNPAHLAAVTFTRKAAGELRERFQARLEQRYCVEADLAVKGRLAETLANLDRVFLGTIHSFAARLLRERPLEAGLSPDFTEVEGLEEQELLESSWEEYLTETRLNCPERLRRLDELDVSPQELKSAYKELVLYPDVKVVSAPAPYPDLRQARAEFYSLLDSAGACLPDSKPDRGWDSLQTFCRLALRHRRIFDLNDDRRLLRLLERLGRNTTIVQNRWPCKNTAKQLLASFLRFRGETVEPLLNQWRSFRHQPLLEFLLPAVDSFHKLRVRENKVNFQDLLMRLSDTLRDNQEVREYFRSRCTHLLVDEFQDTDPIQAQIMLYLTGTDLTEKDWTRLVPRPGSLFVVGDPKQSIYRFRRADIDIYNQVRHLIENSGGRVLRLTANFRSLPEIVAFANTAFTGLFSAGSEPYQAAFTPMQDMRRPVPSATGIFCLPVDADNNQEAIAAADAGNIASWIRGCLDSGLILSRAGGPDQPETPTPAGHSDFMILVRYKKHISAYARALEEFNIPFTVSGGGQADIPELYEFQYLLQTVADPDNPVPLVATLRGLFFGASDDELYRFKLAGGLFNFTAPPPDGTPDSIKDAFVSLCRYRDWSRSLPAVAAVEKISEDLGLLPYALSGSMGKSRAGCIILAMELLRRHEQAGPAGFAAAAAFLERHLSDGTEEELAIEGGRTACVRIMNLHKAKGLEAPVVILANPGKRTTHTPSLHVTRVAGEPLAHICLQHKKDEGKPSRILAEPAGWETHAMEENKYQQAEEIRLLYVAATRAKNILVISTYPRNPEKSAWHPLEAFLQGAEQLIIPEQLPFSQTIDAPPITSADLEQAKKEQALDMVRLMSPSYSRTTVTDLVKASETPDRFHTGRGRAWGSMLHKALEILVREEENINLDEMVTSLVRGRTHESVSCEEIHKILQEITATPFWQRVRLSAAKYTEVPFGLRHDQTYLTGTVDLAFRDEDGWVLVDYKTDTVRDQEHLDQLISYYSPQITEYARRWQEITGEHVKERGLFFLDGMRYYCAFPNT
jgi:ATP-dependent helicase/nuclease subunit A